MIFTVPKSDIHSQVKITVRTSRGPSWGWVACQDNSLPTFDVEIPPSINPDDVEVFIEFLFGNGAVDQKVGATVLKTMKRQKLPPRA